MDDFEKYESWVENVESKYADYAFRSTDVVYLDGTTFEEYYSHIFRSDDTFNKERNIYRTPFQLERDRILSLPLFQRLAEKTQLFTIEKENLTENRLTHTLKVMQISRSIARGLGLNEDLVEALALGHDIGHPPFAHIGEEALNEWLTQEFKTGQTTLSKGTISAFRGIPKDILKEVKIYFTFGNDPREKLFMHGRQGFRLLVLKRKEEKRDHLRYTRPVMYGIWRHSVGNFNTDKDFRFKETVSGREIKFTGKDDLTLETQIVRYADDIAWITSDLMEGICNGILKYGSIESIIQDIENSTLSMRISDILNKKPPKTVELFTIFISDIIKSNLDKLQDSSDPKKVKISFSPDIEELFKLFKGLIEELHNIYYMARGSQINKARIKALCTWYFDNPHEFVTEMKSMMHDLNFPIHSIFRKECREYDHYDLYEDLITQNNVYRRSVVVDFVSSLTDREIFQLSETMPIK
jgi:predicted deoxyguanosinetriphosphate triphosphohydrolase